MIKPNQLRCHLLRITFLSESFYLCPMASIQQATPQVFVNLVFFLLYHPIPSFGNNTNFIQSGSNPIDGTFFLGSLQATLQIRHYSLGQIYQIFRTLLFVQPEMFIQLIFVLLFLFHLQLRALRTRAAF